MIAFDWTITLGTVLAALVITTGTWAAISRLYSLLDKRLALFESMLETHARTLLAHAARMEKQDDMIVKASGDLQRIMGRLNGGSE